MIYADNNCECIEEYDLKTGNHTYTFKGISVDTKEELAVTVKAEDLFKYRQGELIQKAFPYLPASDREFLLSGWVN